ncbi:LysR family transcriptional regulator [Acidobacterium sp. S8]|uniref:LysR family transcriptional regulator n=1 Tax=Acidobacterium sp. S8 TaxID=1641854 RepID=UPI00131CB3FD|nr:LysR family transcriptional regulator [Acidobacterium sp. S8]
MLKNDTKLMESVIALAEELHFGRAARRLRISQPMLTKNIQDVEALIGGPLFLRDRKHVVLSDAGRSYVQYARLSLQYSERAAQAARAILQNADVPLYIGRSPYTDPFLISTLLSIELPLYPRLKIELRSQYSFDMVHDLLAGTLDFAIATEPPESPLLTMLRLAEAPFYIAMSKKDELANNPSVTLEMMAERRWILFERRLHPPLYDSILHVAEQKHVSACNIQHVTTPEEAFPFVVDGLAIALITKSSALLMARNGVTVRPLLETGLLLRTYLISRVDDDSKVAGELVRAFARKLSDVNKYKQIPLPLSA